MATSLALFRAFLWLTSVNHKNPYTHFIWFYCLDLKATSLAHSLLSLHSCWLCASPWGVSPSRVKALWASEYTIWEWASSPIVRYRVRVERELGYQSNPSCLITKWGTSQHCPACICWLCGRNMLQNNGCNATGVYKGGWVGLCKSRWLVCLPTKVVTLELPWLVLPVVSYLNWFSGLPW